MAYSVLYMLSIIRCSFVFYHDSTDTYSHFQGMTEPQKRTLKPAIRLFFGVFFNRSSQKGRNIFERHQTSNISEANRNTLATEVYHHGESEVEYRPSCQ